ncbi:MAG TPA: carboxy terminal-processing peptidase [Cyclobacteriaceae bacterium]|nr:carboxy terminal-processing peptidase [Cyclobacteriaceae bacterium]
MIRAIILFFAVQLSILVHAATLVSDTTTLKPKEVYGKEARVISYILDNNHYRRIKLNDSLSSAILDKYLEDLDNNKTYFLASDVKAFDKYRYSIDDMTREEDVSPAYAIYDVFQKRYHERMDYVMNDLIHRKFDYTEDEYYETDREKEPWANSIDELNDLWRKIIKSQALGLKLAGKNETEIVDALKRRYERFIKNIDQFNSEDVFSLYMNSITEAYDPHTNYLSPKASDLFKQSMSLSLEGIGARLQTDNDFTKVFEVLPGGPAEKSGKIHANDLITAVGQGDDGEMVDVVGWRVDEVVKLIKGPKGTTVRLQVLPAETGVNGPSQEVVLVREKIKLEDQAAKKNVINYKSGDRNMKLGVISLPTFYMDFDAYQKGDPNYRSTTRDVKKLIQELQAEGVDGLVMDLRNNGGGSLAEAIDLTGLFIKDGPVVQVKNSINKVEIGMDDDKGILYNGPLVVMTNRFSASASEIFAGAIQDYHRGVIVGESTYGKGTVQTVLDLGRFINDKEEVGELKLTFQKFYRVTGSSTQNKGVTPDIILPSALSSEQYGESSNLSALPWDVIKGTPFQRASDVNDKVLAGLNRSYQERTKYDPSLKRYITETEELKKNLSQTKISLNESIRKKEMEEAEKKRALSKNMNTRITNSDGLPVDELEKLNDEYLREGLLILSDLVTSRIG